MRDEDDREPCEVIDLATWRARKERERERREVFPRGLAAGPYGRGWVVRDDEEEGR